MRDIHCHILPDVDDGPEELRDALSMGRMAADCGVRDIITTPHFRGTEERDFYTVMKRSARNWKLQLRRTKMRMPLCV